MPFKSRILVGAAVPLAAVVVTAVLAWVLVASRPDPVAALRQRLVGESARGVESILGEPAFRDHGDRTWHYVSDAKVRQFAGDAAVGSDLIVELDDSGRVERVYLEQ